MKHINPDELLAWSKKVSERVPLKQGLKHGNCASHAVRRLVSERVPLKQGLKLCSGCCRRNKTICLRESSIKTRIETRLILQARESLFLCLRESSIKTRIETFSNEHYHLFRKGVSERVPLKQGLKLFSPLLGGEKGVVSERVPLKQGLKPYDEHAVFKLIQRRLRESSIKTRIETEIEHSNGKKKKRNNRVGSIFLA